uniref:IlGF domain-containing protein n=1 Tax=Globodera pallida TaxID=36090 RepID=A0A183CJ53_GLOPA
MIKTGHFSVLQRCGPKFVPILSIRFISFSSSLLLLVLLAPDAEAFVRRPNNGLMKLCPPGGQSFAAAWEITCGMRRRKREVLAPTTTTDNNDVEQQQSQQQMTNSNDKSAGDGMPEQRPPNATATISNATPKTWWKSIGDILFGRSITGPPNEDALASNDEDKQLYRPPSMTEMMLFCCRFGCSLRDLMPFCDPFGAWDS